MTDTWKKTNNEGAQPLKTFDKNKSAQPSRAKERYFSRLKRDLKTNRSIYMVMLLPVIWYIIFCYLPMGGILMGFQDYNIRRGMLGSEWVGLENFRRFFSDPYFGRDIINTIRIGLANIIFTFPMPIIFALMLNELNSKCFTKTVQTVTYIPHFISLVVICGMIQTFVADDGIITGLIETVTGKQIGESLLNQSGLFTTIFVASDIWQGMGWSSIIYIAAIAGVDQELYEAASIDGAGRLRKVLHVTIPALLPTIIIMFILKLGSVVSVSYEKIMLLINPLNAEKAEVLSYYIYKKGLVNSEYSLSTAAGLFNGVINLLFVIGGNYISRRVSETSLW